MFSFLFSLFLLTAAAANASSPCLFHLHASGGISGPVWQLDDGQLRVGGDHECADFTIKDGGITDSKGSGCILTPEVRQFQCDKGVGPLHGFSIGENGVLSYSQNPTFYACPASEVEWNIYTVPVAGQLKCVAITLTADNCHAPAYHAPPPPVYQPPPPPKYEPPPPVYQPPPPAAKYEPPPPPVYQNPTMPAYPATTAPPYYDPAPSVCTGQLITICIPSATYGGSNPCVCYPEESHSNVYVTPTSSYYATSTYYAPSHTSTYYAPAPSKYPPKYEAPKYGKPEYGKPKYGEPKYGKPEYGKPAYGKPKYGEPKYGKPEYGRPEYGKPKYGEPKYGKPAYGKPKYGEPKYGKPAYGTPKYGEPKYGKPSYGYPEYGTPYGNPYGNPYGYP
ncbi:hypothetical protein K3495_g5795 [Podosphaera aphanis]|nr:hypothetical protein K3495_g5795 [Podosphaera aphanis]